MKEELRDGEARMNHATWWDGITKMSERRPPLGSFICHKIRLNLEENTHYSHKNCAKFLYYNFNLSNTLGRPPIYRWRSHGEQAKRVRWKKGKNG